MREEILLQMVVELADKAWRNDIEGKEHWLSTFDIYFDDDEFTWKFITQPKELESDSEDE